MTDSERLKCILAFLIQKHFVRNQQDLAERIAVDKATMSQLKTGKKEMTESFATKISNTFPQLNKNWLLTGEGEMLNTEATEEKSAEASAPAPAATPSEEITMMREMLGLMKQLVEQNKLTAEATIINARANERYSRMLENITMQQQNKDEQPDSHLIQRQGVG